MADRLEEENPVESPANREPDDTEQTNEDAATSMEPPGQVAKSTEGLTVGGTGKEPTSSDEDASNRLE